MATKTQTSGSTANEIFINISAYKFVRLDQLPTRKNELLQLCERLNLKGTILLSEEGINIFVAGIRANIDQLVQFFESKPEYANLPIKESQSDDQPFTRMLVRIKKEIIAFGVDGIEPDKRTSPKLKPDQLKNWLDEGKRVTLLDVRNDYEVDLGTFDNALPIGVDHFRDFPSAVEKLSDDLKDETIVMFCTGGIRCEKAGPFMEQAGYSNVYQLDGGILKYFEDCGGEHYNGECFVFDKRVALDPQLNETATEQCYACQHPLTAADQESDHYVVGRCCPHCFDRDKIRQQELIEERNETIAKVTQPLPGSIPYDNHRPMNVPLKFDRMSLPDFLMGYHPHVDSQYWENEIETGRILYKDDPLDRSSVVWAGQRLVHLLQGTVEPEVNGDIKIIYEDDEIIAVNKPAPIAMHPCGRFNRNTLSYILNAVYQGEKIRMTHRLDANTTGVVVFARKRLSAQKLQTQFERGSVRKTYLARVNGHPEDSHFACDAAIASQPGDGGLRLVDEAGLTAKTEFSVIERCADGTSLLQCIPTTGRTNQIRLHLWHLGMSIVNDPSYLSNRQLGTNQTLTMADSPMCLHASSLVVQHPVKDTEITFACQNPEWFDPQWKC